MPAADCIYGQILVQNLNGLSCRCTTTTTPRFFLILGKKPLVKTNGISYYKTNDISL
ncbi:hypothetical protein MU1_03150 [Paenibacillus glycanilyticus]|uniref:Uncharacterized protein n=1 Tax=Paenibacillus glycanilyticus TaxID=126569 RepID=A0ABQ6G4T9_9BACL|nr:hypothetical protein MU1_03150 [Paenibacillus glycanilyticus]